MIQPTRRAFLASSMAAIAAVRPTVAQAAPSARPPVCVFSKHLQFLDYAALAEAGRSIGLDGFDLTVRANGHVVPERVATDLPKAVAAIRDAGLEVPMITTNLNDGADPTARPILAAASALGIRYFRVGGLRYSEETSPREQLREFEPKLRSLAEAAEEFGMVAGYHNHSGPRYVAGPLWDLLQLVEGIASPSFGSNFDVGHAKVEGAYGAWETTARAMASHVKMMAVKDFVWRDDASRPQWVPVGAGYVPLTELFTIMRAAGFGGPVSIHFEYDTPSNDALIEDMREAVATVRAALSEAGYA